jgi:hypothetical protein
MKIVLLLLALVLVVSPSLAIMNDVPTSLNTTYEQLRFADICRATGMAQSLGQVSTISYNSRMMGYPDFYTAITNCNEVIRGYNLMMKGLFNESIASQNKVDEFSL